jgi:cob(I)alamin adenosyltransferase
MQKGIIIVFTGDGKGKTTAAIGTALRAIGHRLRVCIIQFIKQAKSIEGEYKALQVFCSDLEFHTLGLGFIRNKRKWEAHKKKAKEAFSFAEGKIFSGKFDLVILDELTYIINLNLLNEQEVLSSLKQKPPHVHILITGRGATPSLIAIADLVTECKQIKHPFYKGQKALKGIEF